MAAIAKTLSLFVLSLPFARRHSRVTLYRPTICNSVFDYCTMLCGHFVVIWTSPRLCIAWTKKSDNASTTAVLFVCWARTQAHTMTPGVCLRPLVRWALYCQDHPDIASPFDGPGGWDFDFENGKPYTCHLPARMASLPFWQKVMQPAAPKGKPVASLHRASRA